MMARIREAISNCIVLFGVVVMVNIDEEEEEVREEKEAGERKRGRREGGRGEVQGANAKKCSGGARTLPCR